MGFENLRVGDVVVRMLAGTLPMKLQVLDITDQLIVCSAWQFDRATGAEIDEELGWGPPPLMTGAISTPHKQSLTSKDSRLTLRKADAHLAGVPLKEKTFQYNLFTECIIHGS